MLQLSDYDVFVFDCDGVIFDSNELKIEAMRIALDAFPANLSQSCVAYFRENFGKSRYHHVEHFVNEILRLTGQECSSSYDSILDKYASQCFSLYLASPLTSGFTEFINSISGHKYVASGSDEAELRSVFTSRELTQHFVSIFGSPTKKTAHLKHIVEQHPGRRVLMIGDAVSDLNAALDNDADFLFISEYSASPESVRAMKDKYDFFEAPTLNSLLKY